jgi:DtxR family Mn-dependent transcriptional regulator
MVLRRHRLVELFLVKVLGMSWAEVHDDAERLEHAVSDRLIDRIDEMLGRPAFDPHGDPIPDAHGTIATRKLVDLLTTRLDAPVVVARVIDQEPDFLRFVEQCELVPGERVTVIARDPASDAVHVRTPTGRDVTIGARAAAKILVKPE